MNKDSVFQKAIGKYFYVRSSESADALIYWNEPEYDEESGRWFESCGCSFCNYEDAKAMEETDDIEMELFRKDHPDICVKETFCEILYDENNRQRAEVYVILIEYDHGKSRLFSFTIEHADKQKVEEIVGSIHTWHNTDELRIGDFSSYCCSGAWSQ